MPVANIANIAWAIQSAKGTPATASVHRLYLAGGDQVRPERVKGDFEETTGGRMLSDAYISQVSVAGAPECFVMPDSIGSLLYAALGARAVTGLADPYVHTFTAAASLPYLTFWRMLANGLFERFADVKVTNLKLSGESGRPLRVTVTVMGLNHSFLAAAEATATIEVTNRFMHYDASGALLVEGAAVASISSFTIEIDNGGALQSGDSLTPNDVSESRLGISVTTDQLVTDYALWNRLHHGSASPSNLAAPTPSVLELAGSPAGLQWTWTRVAASPGPERSLRIAIPRVQVDPFSLQPTTAADPLRQQVTYRAYQPSGGTSPLTATLRNSRASY